jgi:hypothetical protein
MISTQTIGRKEVTGGRRQVGIFTVVDLLSKVGFGLYFLFNYGA